MIFYTKILIPFTEKEFLSIKVFNEKVLELIEIPKERLIQKFLITHNVIENIYKFDIKKNSFIEEVIEKNLFKAQILEFRNFTEEAKGESINEFNKVCKIIYPKIKDKTLLSYLKYIKRNWNHNYFLYKEKNIEVKVDKLINYFFNTQYFHLNDKNEIIKKLQLEEIFKYIPEEVLEMCFFHSIQFKITQILKLHHLVNFLEKDSNFLTVSLILKDFSYKKHIYNIPYNNKLYIMDFLVKHKEKYFTEKLENEKTNLD